MCDARSRRARAPSCRYITPVILRRWTICWRSRGSIGLTVVEDAAHALPASYRGRRVGTIGDVTAFSFYATKNLTTGEGGMLTTADGALGRAAADRAGCTA